MSNTSIGIKGLSVVIMLGPFFACASPSVPTHIEILAASCAACHGTNGNSVGGPPSLAGADATQFVSKMQAFSNKELPSTVMYHHAKGLTEEEIRQLGDYFAHQKPTTAHSPTAQRMEKNHER